MKRTQKKHTTAKRIQHKLQKKKKKQIATCENDELSWDRTVNDMPKEYLQNAFDNAEQ